MPLERQKTRTTATPLRTNGLAAAACLLLLGAGVVFRVIWVDRLPGVNGDEGWYGAQAARMVDGRQWSLLTPSNLPTNPLLLLTEAGLLTLWAPSVLVLRMPILIWSCVSLGLTYCLHRWVFNDPNEAMLTTVVTACLPAHLAYSRFCWDASFGFVSLPLVLYATLRITSHGATFGSWVCWVVGSVLSVWVHATNAALIFACFVALGWEQILDLVRRTVTALRARCGITIAMAAAGLTGLIVWRWDFVIWLVARGDVWLMHHYGGFWQGLAMAAGLLTGVRVYEYLAGMPRPNWVGCLHVVMVITGLVFSWVLWRSRIGADRTLVVLLAMNLIFVALMWRRLRLAQLSYERYTLYLLPLGVAVFVRATHAGTLWGSGQTARRLPRVICTVLSAAFLGQFWLCYFRPLEDQRNWSTMSQTACRTFLTGSREPKSAVAAAIQQRASSLGSFRLYAEDWSLQWPIDYFLRGRYPVRSMPLEFEHGIGLVVVCYAGGSFARQVASETDRHGWHIRQELFGDRTGRAILAMLIIQEHSDADGTGL